MKSQSATSKTTMTMESIEHNIRDKIIELRGTYIILDRDLAVFYEIETRKLKQAVRRNIDRFPTDFMFELTEKEIEIMVSQSVIPSRKYFGGSFPYAFTEQGVANLSSILTSKRAIERDKNRLENKRT